MRLKLAILALFVLAATYLALNCRQTEGMIERGGGIRHGKIKRACPTCPSDSAKALLRWKIG